MDCLTLRALGRVRLPLTVLLMLAAVSLGLVACGDDDVDEAGEESPIRLEQHPDGDPEIGESLVESYGCVTCHVIPGVDENSHVGPPLTNFARREYIAGRIPNGAENLVLWIMNPQSVDPETAMPDVGASEEEAQHIAAFLATLE